MKKLVGILAITIVILGIISGFLFYQLSLIQTQNTEIQNQNSGLQNQLDDLKINNNELNSQISDLQSQNNDLQNQFSELEVNNKELQNIIDEFTNKVKIIKFSVSGFYPIGGPIISSSANVTIQNMGINDVEKLTLEIKNTNAESYRTVLNLDPLHSGEIREITARFQWILGSSGELIAILKLDNEVLDEYILP
jgi:DNA repair exonuclease SbcCD ATPase subunit